MDLTPKPTLFWKERLMGKGLTDSKMVAGNTKLDVDDDFDFYEGDIKRLTVNGIPSIEFSKRLMDIENEYFLAKFQSYMGSDLLGQAMEAQVHMDQSSLVSEAALLPVVSSNEAATIVGTIMGVETQCATTSHFNLTFERLMEFGILMSDGSLDPEKHSSVTFKENFSRNYVCTVREESGSL
ncbi:hypothetical protein GOBAR_AA10649 [Gossypium barbadense]|uniref:Uncharacterized protein n=1 Tax=Gossypium barbadense TaxID=3634 RepID=A0A2P5Y314_GOSBA|nr:hypothetical protein GOBAR_AA10649 [Gossypium barbadense]